MGATTTSVEMSVATHVKVATLYTQGKPCPLILDKVEGNLQGVCGEWRQRCHYKTTGLYQHMRTNVHTYVRVHFYSRTTVQLSYMHI